MTLEQKAWQLHEMNVSYGELAMLCEQFDCTMDEATEIKWDNLFKS